MWIKGFSFCRDDRTRRSRYDLYTTSKHKEEYKKLRFSSNFEKTQYIRARRQSDYLRIRESVESHAVNTLVYLGSIISNIGKVEEDVVMKSQAMRSLRGIIWNKKTSPEIQKRNLYVQFCNKKTESCNIKPLLAVQTNNNHILRSVESIQAVSLTSDVLFYLLILYENVDCHSLLRSLICN